MKKSFFLLSGGAALFAAGWFVRGFNSESSNAPGKAGPVTSVVQQHASPGPASPEKGSATAADSSVRPFTPGRPFAKGRAREWLAGLAARMGGDRRGNAIMLVATIQAFMTMDDDSVREALTALEELIAAADAENPNRRRNPNGDGKLDPLLELSMMRLAQSRPEEALTVLKKNFSLNDGNACLFVFGTLTHNDPQRAEQLALSMDQGQQKDALKAVMYGLLNNDPQAALALAARHPGILGENYRERIFEGWVKTDPKAAMAAAAAEKNTEIIRNTVEEWAKTDPAAAAQWAASYEGPGHVTARAMVLERRAREDPQAALPEYATLQQAASDPKELERLTSSLADAFSAKDVTAARAWAETLPDAELRNRALHQVAEEWVKRDAPAASEWIRSLPPGQLRDSAAKELTSAIARRDPPDAFAWARSIENAKLREDALRTVMQNWRELDPDASKAAMESLPAEMRPQ